MNFDFSSWKEYKVSDIFHIINGKGITKEEIEYNPGDMIAVQSGEENNGCIGKISKEYCVEMGYRYSDDICLTVARSGTAGFVSLQPYGCVVGDSAKILKIKDASHSNLYVYLFLRTILLFNRYKYTFGRKVTEDNYSDDIIMLPSVCESPDWLFMEQYIKELLQAQIEQFVDYPCLNFLPFSTLK